MKQLSVEEKAKRYDEILARATGANLPYYTEDIMTKVREFVEYLLPELKESEGEKIRKALIKLVKKAGEGYENVIEGVSIENAISWLKKQGEHAKFCDSIQVGDKVTRNQDGVLVNLSQLNRVAKKQGEQKPVIIPKFRVGDVIQLKAERLAPNEDTKIENTRRKITGITDYYYTTDTCAIICFEQQDCFELVEQTHAWGKEDEDYYNSIVEHLKYSITNGKPETYIGGRLTDWLKSLKDRYTWKPSEAQMRVLDLAIKCGINRGTREETTLVSLFNDLKKL